MNTQSINRDNSYYQRLFTAFEFSSVGAWELDFSDSTVIRTLRHDKIFGYQELLPEWTYEHFLSHVHPDDRYHVESRFRDTIERGADWNLECRISRAAGEERWIRTAARMFDKPEGKGKRLSGIVEDITDIKSFEKRITSLLKEKELLLKESHHRVKNNMGALAGLLTYHSSQQRDPDAASVLQDAASRAQSMMVLYDRLYTSEQYEELNFQEYLGQLIRDTVELNDPSGHIRAEIAGDDFPLNSRIVAPLGIILTELVTNSVKHAFYETTNAVIYASAIRRGNTVTVEYSDNGIRWEPPQRNSNVERGFGLELIEMLVEQLEGTLSVSSEEGTRYQIQFRV